MFWEPNGVEAELLRIRDLLEHVLIELRRVLFEYLWVPEVVGESEIHSVLPLWNRLLGLNLSDQVYESLQDPNAGL